MMKIAVVGSGISGMTSAYLLSKKYEVHLFEADDRLGGHTATVDVDAPSGRYAIDTGFIVFNDWTYPNFIKLLREIQVPWVDSEMSFSVKNEKTKLEYNGADLNRLFIQRSNLLKPSFYKMLLEIMRFNREASRLVDDSNSHNLSLGTFLEKHRFSKMFFENYISPMGGAIWSSNNQQMKDFPFHFFARFFKNHGMLSVDERPIWKVIRGGSRSYIDPLTRPYRERIHLGSPVISIKRKPGAVEIRVGGKNPRIEDFDQVVFACHSDTTKKIIGIDMTALEQEILAPFQYQSNDVILHTDESVMPVRRGAWAAWNVFIPALERSRVAVSYHMNTLQRLDAPENFVVSLNLTDRISPDKIIKRFTYDHPLYTLASIRSQARWNEISRPELRTHFCGAYWRNGFHEDGVVSALKVCETLGVQL